jgi:hypothetical protein
MSFGQRRAAPPIDYHAVVAVALLPARSRDARQALAEICQHRVEDESPLDDAEPFGALLFAIGFDSAVTACAILVRPTTSTSLPIQQRGWVLRPFECQAAPGQSASSTKSLPSSARTSATRRRLIGRR